VKRIVRRKNKNRNDTLAGGIASRFKNYDCPGRCNAAELSIAFDPGRFEEKKRKKIALADGSR
jgi:hypothetical protein